MSIQTDFQGNLSTPPQEFFNKQWQIYQKVLLNNYMGHREIYEVLHDWLISSWQKPFQLLDLGCGDACFISHALVNTSIAAYTGVDFSEVALAIARENLASLPASLSLIQDDFSQCLPELARKESHGFDIIFTSFALHHLSLEQKETIVGQIASMLASDGIFVLIDTICSLGENRKPYIERYLDNVRQDWSLLESQEITMVEDHMRSSDFPETQETWFELAKKHGLTQLECLYRDPLDTTQILCFSKK
jgi:ubiquinone/menaquinone biosynthesis C-methylase UbiE